jgi:hypothetical protein
MKTVDTFFEATVGLRKGHDLSVKCLIKAKKIVSQTSHTVIYIKRRI